jgi:hypothetical protein
VALAYGGISCGNFRAKLKYIDVGGRGAHLDADVSGSPGVEGVDFVLLHDGVHQVAKLICSSISIGLLKSSKLQ